MAPPKAPLQFVHAVAILVAFLGAPGCTDRQPRAASAVDLEDLLDGDLAPDRSPPFVPSEKLKGTLDRRVGVTGEASFLPDGRVFLTRSGERVASPFRMIACKPTTRSGGARRITGTAYGVLRIRPRYDGTGRLESVYELDDMTIEPRERSY